MSNRLSSNSFARSGIAPSNATHRHLFHCAAVALALAAAALVTVPKLETAAMSEVDTGAQTVATATPETAAGCIQSWPYYERSCLHDSRQREGNTPTVRVIAPSGPRHASRH